MFLTPKILKDPQFKLSRKSQRNLVHRASNEWFKQRLNIAIFAIFTVGWIAASVALPLIFYSQGLSSTTTSAIRWLVIYPLSFVTLSYLLYRFRYLKHIYQELRDLGHDICLTCGYTLINLPESETNCPECGTPRTKPHTTPIVPSD